MTDQYSEELKLAELAVQKAALATEKIRKGIEKGVFSKADDEKTPVTIADFASQAILVSAIRKRFPQDVILAEEETSMLRENPELCFAVWDLVSSTRLEDAEAESLVPSPSSQEEMLEYIDFAGLSNGSPTGRVWIIDPIDGTKTFVNGGLYVVICALVVDGEEKVAALGVPVLDLSVGQISDFHYNKSGPGHLLSATRGFGAQIRSLSNGSLLESKPISMMNQPQENSEIRFVEPEPGRRFQDAAKIAETLSAPFNPSEVYSAQSRYVAMALGTGNAMLRIKTPEKAKMTFVYDHAGGMLILEEVGGKVTDVNGKRLDFSYGRRFEGNFCIIAAAKSIHARVLEAAREVLGSHPEYAKALV